MKYCLSYKTKSCLRVTRVSCCVNCLNASKLPALISWCCPPNSPELRCKWWEVLQQSAKMGSTPAAAFSSDQGCSTNWWGGMVKMADAATQLPKIRNRTNRIQVSFTIASYIATLNKLQLIQWYICKRYLARLFFRSKRLGKEKTNIIWLWLIAQQTFMYSVSLWCWGC